MKVWRQGIGIAMILYLSLDIIFSEQVQMIFMIERYQFVFGIDIIMIGHILFYTCFSTLWNWPIKVLQQHGHKTKTLGQAIMETLCKILC